MGIQVHLNNVRVSFAHGLFKASAMQADQQKKFGADFIIDDRSKVLLVVDGKKVPGKIRDAELKAAAEAWKGNAAKVLATLEPSKRAVREGDAKVDKAGEVRDGYAGHLYVTAKTATRPTVIDRDRTPLDEASGVIFSGCRVNAIIELYANTAPTKKGVFAGLKGVQFVAKDEAFGGSAPASADDFDDLGDGAEGEDFGGGDDGFGA